MAVISRKLQGEQLREDKTGLEATITDQVTAVTPNADSICAAHNDAGLFEIGDPHPCVLDIYCTDKTTRPLPNDNTVFLVDYVFRGLDAEDSPGGDFSMSGSLVESIATRDRDGLQVVLAHTYPDTYKDPVLAGQTRNQIAEFEAAKPTLLLRWSRLRDTFAEAWGNRGVLGKTNSAAQWGFPTENLLCTRMEIERAGQKWREIFEFQSAGVDWTVPTVFQQEDDNRPVENPAIGAEADVHVYPVYDYSLLGLLLPS